MASASVQLLESLRGFDCETALAGIDSTWIGVLIAATTAGTYANANAVHDVRLWAWWLPALRLENLVHADDLHALRDDLVATG